MRKFSLSFLSLSLLLASGPYKPLASELAPAEQEVIVTYHNSSGKKAIIQNSNEVEYQFRNVAALAVTVDQKDLAKLQKDPNVDHIEKNVTLKITEANISAIRKEEAYWHFQAVNPQAQAFNQGLTGSGVKVGVIDSGIARHSDLNIAGGISTVDYTSSYFDDNGHGTHVAGIIGAKRNGYGISGIAPDAELYSIKTMDSGGEGTLQDIAEGIDWAISNTMDIINLSIGTTYDSPLLHDMVDRAYERGILVVASAGNDAREVNYPAKYSSVMAVSAINSNRNLAYFSSRGPEVEFSAPGVGIISTYLDNTYVKMDGTSQASPHAAGLLALLKQKYSTLSAWEMRLKLQKYTDDLGAPGRDSFFGYGSINFSAFKEESGLDAAVAQVSFAEKSRSLPDLELAEQSVSKLGDGSVKTDLQNRLENLRRSIQEEAAYKEKLSAVTLALQHAEKTLQQKDAEAAESLVFALPAGADRDRFLLQLSSLKERIILQQKITSAETAISQAEQLRTIAACDEALSVILALPEGSVRSGMQGKVENLKQRIQEELAKQLAEAKKYVAFSQLYKTDYYIGLAQKSVHSLPAGSNREGLQKLLDTVKADVTAKITSARKAVQYAEKYKTDYYAKNAQTAINALPYSDEKSALLRRLGIVKSSIAKAKLEQAKKSVLLAEKYKSVRYVKTAQTAVNSLHAGNDRSSLQKRINTLSAKMPKSRFS